MYSWLWRHLPGDRIVRSLLCAVIAFAVVALLFTVVFPWATSRLPFLNVTVDSP